MNERTGDQPFTGAPQPTSFEFFTGIPALPPSVIPASATSTIPSFTAPTPTANPDQPQTLPVRQPEAPLQGSGIEGRNLASLTNMQDQTLAQLKNRWLAQNGDPSGDPKETIKQTVVYCRLLDQDRECSVQKNFEDALNNLQFSKSTLAVRLINTGWTTVFNRRLKDKEMISSVFRGVGSLLSQDRDAFILIYVRSLRLPKSFIAASDAQPDPNTGTSTTNPYGLGRAMLGLKAAKPDEWRTYWISLQVKQNVIASNRWIVFGGISYLAEDNLIKDQQANNNRGIGIEYVIGGKFGLERAQPQVEHLLHEFLTVGAEIFLFSQRGQHFNQEEHHIGQKVLDTMAEVNTEGTEGSEGFLNRLRSSQEQLALTSLFGGSSPGPGLFTAAPTPIRPFSFGAQ